MRSKKFFILILILILCALHGPAHAIKVSGGSFASSFHIGGVIGFGLGINFGMDAGIPIGDFELGAEIEQAITDYKFEVSVNTTRLGLLVRYQIIEGLLSAGIHTGSTRFTTSKDTTFSDASSGDKISLVGGDEYKASYVSASIDYALGDLIITPRFYINYIEGGTLYEFDINLGMRF